MFEVIYNGMTRGQMISDIHMECDTSAGCYSMTDEQLIQVYKQVFQLDK